jgi:hypothetical protein
MKKLILTACAVGIISIASLAQQDTASTDFNNNPPPVEQSQDQEPSPNLDQTAPTQDQATPPTDQSAPPTDQQTPTQDPPTEPSPATPTPPVGPTEDQSMDQPTQDGNNAIQQGQSRESEGPTQDQTDQSTERPNEMTPVEGKEGPNGEAIFMENGKYYYLNEAGEKTKIKKSQLRDKQ